MTTNYRDDTLEKIAELKVIDMTIADKLIAYSKVQFSIAYLDPLTNTYIFLHEAPDFPLNVDEASELLLAKLKSNLYNNKRDNKAYMKRLINDLSCALMEE